MNKILSTAKKTLFILFIATMFLAVICGFGALNTANASVDFSVEYKYNKTMMPKGTIGQEYKLKNVATIKGNHSISCMINFDEDSTFAVTNGSFTPEEYGVYTISIIPADSSFSTEEFNVLIDSADGEKSFDYAGKIGVTNGSFRYGESGMLYGIGVLDAGTTMGGKHSFTTTGLVLDFTKAGKFTFADPIDINNVDSFIDVGIAGGTSYDDHQNKSFNIILTDANNSKNTVTIHSLFNADAYYCKAGHAGMGGVLLGKESSTIYASDAYSTATYVSPYGAYTSNSYASTFKSFGISAEGVPFVKSVNYNSSTDTLSYDVTNKDIIGLKNSAHVGENIWQGFSSNKVYVSIEVNKKMSLMVTKLGGLDLTDKDCVAYQSTIEDYDPTIEVKGATNTFYVGDQIDLLDGVSSDGVYGNYVYSPLVDCSVVKIEGTAQTPVTINGGIFVPNEKGVYVCSYVANDFDGDSSEVKKRAIVVLDKEQEITLNDVIYQDCNEGDTVDIQVGSLNIDGTEYPATAVVYYPDGSAHAVSSVKTVKGLYRIEYSVFVEGVKYAKNVSFYAKASNYTVGEGYATSSYGESYWTDYVSGNGLKIEVDKGETFVYNKVLNIKNLTNVENIIKFYTMPNELGVPYADTMYVRFTDVYNSENYITLHINEYDGSRDTTYYRVAIGTGTSAASFGGIDWFDKYGCAQSSASLCGYGPYGKNYPDEMIHVNNPFEFSFDYATMSMTLNHGDRFIAKLDNTLLYPTPWKGFTTGECYMSISFDDYHPNQTARIFLTEVAGEPVEEGLYHYDVTKPTIFVDFDGYSTDNLPFGVKNVAYPIFNASALDGYTTDMVVGARVYYDYYGACYTVSVVDGKFVPTRSGIYTIVYSVMDSFGNISEKHVEVNVKDSNDGTQIIVAENDKVTESFVGEKVFIPKFKVENANGRTINKVYVTFDNNIIYEGQDYFVPTKAGVYTITCQAEDFLGIKNKTSYDVTVAESDKVLIKENPLLPKFLIDEYTYILDDLYGFVYVDGKEVAVPVKLSVIDKNNEKVITNNTFTPSVANSGDLVTLVYEFEYNGQTTEYTYEIPAYKVYKEVDGEEVIDMSAYFVGDVESTISSENYAGFVVTKDGAIVDFLSDLVFFNGKLQFAVPENLANFSSLDLLLTGSYGKEQVGVTINLVDGMFESVVYNGAKYTLNTVSSSCIITTSKDSKVITINDTDINLNVDVNGMSFNGFKQGRAYMQFEFNGVTDESGLAFTNINNQLISSYEYDIVRPMINIYENFGGAYLSGYEYTIKHPIYGDVLDPSVRLYLTVLAPGAKYMTATDGTLLKDILCTKEYTIKMIEVGNYNVTFRVASITEKGAVYFWDKDFTYALKIKDVDPPEITVNLPNNVVVAKGGKVTVPVATAEDNMSQNVEVYVYVITPNGRYVSVAGNEFTAKNTGKYTIVYMAVDDDGNIATKTYSVVCK